MFKYLAQPNINQGLNEFLGQTNLTNENLVIVIGNIVKAIIGFLGLIAVIIVIVGGFIWMTSGGNQDKIKKAREIMLAGIIGIVIIVFSYAIATFVLNYIIGLGGGA